MIRNILIATTFMITLLGVLFFFSQPKRAKPYIKGGNESFKNAVLANTIYERQTFFNSALNDYLEAEKEIGPNSGNGKLQARIGDIYQELKEYPLALFYYYKALKLNPGAGEIHHQIAELKSRMGLVHKEEPFAIKDLIVLHNQLPLSLRLQCVFFFSTAAFIAFSFYFWIPRSSLFILSILSSVICIFFVLSTLVTRYIAPIQGVLAKATIPLIAPESESQWVVEVPKRSGSLIYVLSIEKNGWVKVAFEDGIIGYVVSERIYI